MVIDGPPTVAEMRNFFTDFYGLQRLKPEILTSTCTNEEFLQKFQYQLERLIDYFKEQKNLKCVILIEQIKHWLKPYVKNLIKEELINNVVIMCVWQALKDYHVGIIKERRGILKKLPLKVYENVKNNLEYIVANIPSDFFKNTDKFRDDRSITLPIKQREVDLIFWIPMTENDPKIDENPNEMNFILPKTKELKKIDEKYDIYKRYQDYQAKLSEFPYQEFREIIDNGIKSNKTNDELFNDFLDVFGCELFEFVEEIIKNRTKIFIWTSNDYDNDNSNANDNDNRKLVTNRSNYKPIIANQMIVQSEEERNLAKILRKIEKKQKSNNQNNDIDENVDNSNYQSIFKRGHTGENSNDFPHVHDQLRNASVTTKFNGVNIKHPENTVKTETKDFIEFTIPGGKCSNSDRIDLIKIKDLDSIGQLVFKDIKEFNRIQSEVYPIAYHTNENMLICAPTGAGKTNIALLTIVHQIKQYMDGGYIRKDDFKIVYVCPMKALATEMVTNFTKKLGPIGINVKEVTGDMQLTKKEIAETQLLVTTPEKWDVITRKGAVDSEITSLVKLLILDEVHLLNSDRGPVIEALVARTLRQVLSSQNIIRIVALSATLPGYMDVSNFLKINPKSGLYFFDNRYRSVPLTMSFIGIKNKNDNDLMDTICYNKLIPFIKDGKQVMIFVTSRNMTIQVAKNLIQIINNNDNANLFQLDQRKSGYNIKKFKNNDLEYLIFNCIGIHHAGMCRNDRLEIENLFRLGILKIIVCTTTLAWGVNLPAHTVIIRGTTRYDPQKSQYVDLDMLDIQQIFGRAGRPQYDTSGHGIIITNTTNMIKYMSLLVSQTPIESQFLNYLPDNLNAEIVLGTVTNLKEAMEWLTNTFLYCRIRKNPLVYGLTFTDIWDNDRLYEYLERKLYDASIILEQAQMIRFNQELNELRPTNYGRISSFYYINYQTMKYYHDNFNRFMEEADLLLLISRSNEFKHIQVRNDELEELDRLYNEYNEYNYNLDQTSIEYKVITLIQANIVKAKIRITSLISDCEFIIQTVQRLSRALFEIAVDKNYSSQISRCLHLSQMIEQQLLYNQQPLLQFKQFELKTNLRQLHLIDTYTINELKQLTNYELLNLMNNNRQLLQRLQYFLKLFPLINLDVIIKPITDGVIRLKLLIQPDFQWDNNIHGNVQHYYIWVDDPINDGIYHFETFILTKRQVTNNETIELIFTVPVVRPNDCNSGEYFVNVANSKYMHAETTYRIDLEKLHLLPSYTIQTKFLSVRPLPKTALHNEMFEKLYGFTHFNAVQSQVFHCCYNTDNNILLGAPTGSGKTIVSEICILRQFTRRPDLKVVYIAPMKALVRERVRDWTEKFEKISKRIVEVTGDITPHSSLIRSSDIIITTPEKWDGMSRNWLQKDFVKQVGLIIIDEIHLLAEDRGPVLEIIVSRMNYINSIKNAKVRIVGLSTAMANAGDLANWLGIERKGLFNFSSSVRPVPLEIHLQGFSAKNYCPRMATMNRPAYQAICQYAPNSPTLIFVSSRKQTRITSYDLIKCLLSDTNPQQWLHCQQDEIDSIRHQIIDNDLSYLLCFGIGIHHAGLQETDRRIVENLFVQQKIQVLVATATLAWGVNFPAHLVIIKGTEYYDGITKRYVDMPVTDILQMMGRAGRPQYDTSGVACVFVQENKKNFYRKFLFEPFPVESNLLNVLPEHVNAEIANGTVTCKMQLIDLICSTFFFRRLLVNPTYYQLNINDDDDNNEHKIDPNNYLNELSDSVINRLNELKCIEIKPGDISDFYQTTFLGQLSAQYYLSCNTLLYLDQNLSDRTTFDDLIYNICKVDEYKLFPVRHNEDKINKNLSMDLQLRTTLPYDSPHLKVLLLIKCYLYDKKLPNQEYVLDLKTVFDQIIRIIQAMISLTTYKNWLQTTIKLIYLEQMLIQGITINQNPILILPNLTKETINLLKYQLINKQLIGNQKENLTLIKVLLLSRQYRTKFNQIIYDIFDKNRGDEILKVLNRLPILFIDFTIKQIDNDNNITYNINEIDKFIEIDCIKINSSILFEFQIKRDSNSNNYNVYSRKFNKQKEESWFFIISNDNNDELLRMQRFTIKKTKSVDVQIDAPQQRGIYWYSCYFMSDSYIGLDQKLTFRIRVVD